MFRRRIKKTLAVITAALCCMSAGLPSAGIIASADCNICFSCENDAYVRSEPDRSNNVIGMIEQGEMIQVTNIKDGWGMIEYTDDNGTDLIGWTFLELYDPLLLDDTYEFIRLSEDIQQSPEKEIIYGYLAGEMGLNKAAADAAMVNIGCESSYNPESGVIDTNGLPSYGLCQWNGERYDNLIKFCNERGLDCTAIESQMEYLEYEFEHEYSKQYQHLLETENSAGGCYEAGYYWAERFEVCAEQYWEERAEQSYEYYQIH